MKTGKHNKEYLKMWKILMIHVINGISHSEAYLKVKKEMNIL